MLNKLLAFIRRYNMVQPGDTVICAVSGGADSMALLWAMYLLREKLKISLEAAHFNHHLRGSESDRDEAFVEEFCQGYGIPVHLGGARVTVGKKGLEAAARDARYTFLQSLSGKVATAHTADDNAETVLMHMIRGTGLKGLGGISPVRGNVIRPLLSVTREEVCAFLEEYSILFVSDSSNEEDLYLRNRLRHHVMPTMKAENPVLSNTLSAMALRLREDEQLLDQLAGENTTIEVDRLRMLQPGIRNRVLATLLRDFGVREPEAEHIRLLESLAFSQNPSATANFPGDVTVGRIYGRLAKLSDTEVRPVTIPKAGVLRLPEWGIEIAVYNASEINDSSDVIVLYPEGELVLRSRKSGDSIRLPGGTKSLKKLFIDRKIPACQRNKVPIFADTKGILYVHGIGYNLDRATKEGQRIGLCIRSL